MKNFIIGILITALTVVCFAMVQYSRESSELRTTRDQERYNRMKREEELQSRDMAMTRLQNEVKSLQSKLVRMEEQLESEHTRSIQLKTQIERFSTLNADLEQRLQTALEVQAALDAVEDHDFLSY